MISLTPEQRKYKIRTLNQLRANHSLLEAQLEQESRPGVVSSIEHQLADMEAHISRLQDELSGNIVFDEPVAEELFLQAARALAKEKFHLAKKHIQRLETIEPFYPGIERLKQEAESGRASRRTRSIAQGLATSYPESSSIPTARPVEGVAPPLVSPQPLLEDANEAPRGWMGYLFQFHIIMSCLAIMLIICVMLGIGGVTVLQWLIEG